MRDLEALKAAFGRGTAPAKLELLRRLDIASLRSARQLFRLHEILCYWRAYPESRGVLDQVERMLGHFDRRPDFRRHRGELDDTGIAGTALYFRFYWAMAIRLARRWPDRLTVNWQVFENAPRLTEILDLLLPFSETPALELVESSARMWIGRLKGPGETDAAFLIRRFAALRVPPAAREHLYDMLDIPIRLSPGPDAPARGRERWDRAPVVFVKRPPSRVRPPLRRALRKADFSVRSLPPAEARKLIDVANAAMVTRHRDLLIFLHADENDVRIIDFGDGLQFACIGAIPERRLLLEAVYGFLMLKNGVPIGYILNSALFGSCELAFNVFDTFRGSEAGVIYSRFLAAVSRLFKADSFAIDPYQLGHGNREGQLSGAWWFYYKFGFRPHDAGIRMLVREELARMRKKPSHRTSPSRLNRLASRYMFFHGGGRRDDVLGQIPLGKIGLRISRYLAERFGSDRDRGIRTCSREAAELLGVRDIRRLPPGERLAWERWSPLVLALPGVDRWRAAERRALAAVVRAKGGRRESDFVRLFDRHRKLRRAILKLAED